MTTLTALAVPTHSDKDENLRPVPWRRMAWVIWRQHRTALVGVAGLFGALALYLWIAGLGLHHAYAAATACRPAGSVTCGSLINHFNGINGFLSNGLILQPLPALIGAFLGAPLLAREIETGTFRFAWTQAFGRWRWTLAKLAALGLVVAAVAAALGMVISWYFQPYFAAANAAQSLTKQVPIGASPFAPGLFDIRLVTCAAWTLAAFAVGVLAGVLIRRVVPAIVATLAAYAALACAAGGLLRQRYLAPLVTSSLTVPRSAWVIGEQWTKGGRPVNQSVIEEVLERAPGSTGGKGGIPDSVSTMQYLAHHGYTQLASYQPISRFWPLQWIEGGWLFALSVLFMAVTVWIVRRRAV